MRDRKSGKFGCIQNNSDVAYLSYREKTKLGQLM